MKMSSVGNYHLPVIVSVFIGTIIVFPCYLHAACPCQEPALCDPIKTTPKREIFTFSVTDSFDVWSKYNWSLLTTFVAVGAPNNQLMCQAHKNGARIVSMVDFGPPEQLKNKTARQIWITQQVNLVKQYYYDGVNFDFEGTIPESRKDLRDGYTALVAETRKALQAFNPYTQVTVDVFGTPLITSRRYDYAALANNSDFLVVMDYDASIFPSIAASNSGYQVVLTGLQLYMESLKISSSKLVIGVPWYGYNYPCVRLLPGNVCMTQALYEQQNQWWRGASFRYGAGRQYPYKMIVEFLKNSTTGRLWDNRENSPYFNYKPANSSQVHQVWYDDPESLTYKYKLVNLLTLRGAGMWTADMLDSANTPEAEKQRKAMWGALSVVV